MRRGARRAAFLLLVCVAGPHPARASARGDRAVRLLRQGRVAEAIELLRAALQAEPKSATLATDLAYAEQLQGNSAEAERLFRHAIELDPRRWYAYANLAALKAAAPIAAGDRDALVAQLERGIALQPRSNEGAGRAGLLLELADVERASGNLAAAHARLDEARKLKLTPGQARRAAALAQAELVAESKSGAARALDAWPEPRIEPAWVAQLATAESLLARDPAAALREAERLSALHPTWRAPRFLRARALLALEQFESGTRELEALLRLDPAHAAAWRLLGETLAEHGGPFESERAELALRRALALEPAWIELWGLRGRLLFRSGHLAEARAALEREARELEQTQEPLPSELSSLLQAARAAASEPKAAANADAREPSPAARALLREARERLTAGDRPGALDRLARALADSPALAEAAALRWSLDGAAPQETVRALWSDAAGLMRLVQAVQAEALAQALGAGDAPGEAEPVDAGAAASASRAQLEPAAVAALVRPWIERAAELGESEALLERARLRGEEKDLDGALEDLGAAVASGLLPERLERARALREALDAGPEDLASSREAGPSRGDAGTWREDAAEQELARSLLSSARAEDLLAELGGGCASPVEPSRALAIGAAHELLGELQPALACYQAALGRSPDDRLVLSRLARAAARAPLPQLAPLAPQLARAAAAGIPSAFFAQARLLALAARTDEAIAALDRGLAIAGPPGFVEPNRGAARALRQRLEHEQARAGAAHETRLSIAVFVAALLSLGALLFFFRRATVSKALRRDAALFPAVARAVAAIRHDALKHRASALAMLGSAPREEIVRALRGDRPASELIAEAYASLAKAAEARGLKLRRLSREPAFGPLFLDLRAAEAQLTRAAGPDDARITEAASRMHMHGERLGALLKQGPRTRLDASLLSDWIAAVEAELRAQGKPWASPALELQGLELDFPLARAPLAAIFSNLLRNAQAAAAREEKPRVLVRVGEERDAAGRRLLELRIGDSSAEMLSLEQIEARESGRGLALVRDLVREWQGHLRVHREEPPFCKSIAACFPVQSP